MDKINKRLAQLHVQATSSQKAMLLLRTTMAAITFTAIYDGLRRVTEGFVELSKAGAEFERIQKAFQVTAIQMGEGWEEAMGNMRVGTRGTIDDMELMISANKAFALGVVRSSQELAELAKVSTVLGRRTGLGQEVAFERLLVGVGRLSPRILDDLGIAVNLTRLYAEETGKLSSELSQAEKIQALLNFVLREGANVLKEYPNGLEDAASGFERLGASWENLKLQLAQMPASTAIAEGIGNIAEAMYRRTQLAAVRNGSTSRAEVEDLISWYKGSITEIEETGKGLSLGGIALSVADSIEFLNKQIAELTGTYMELASAQRDLDWQPDMHVERVVDYAASMDRAGDIILSMFDELDKAKTGVIAAKMTGDPQQIAKAEQQVINLTELLKIYGTQYNIAAEETEGELIDVASLQQGIVVTQEAAAEIDLLGKVKEKDKDITDAEAEAMKKWIAYQREAKNAVDDLITSIRERAGQDIIEFRASDASPAAKQAAEEMRTALEGQLYYIEYVAQAWQVEEDALRDITVAYNSAKSGLDDYNASKEQAAQAAALDAIGTAGQNILNVLPQLQVALETLDGVLGSDAAFLASSQLSALQDEVEQLAIAYNVAAAAAGLQLIDIEQLRQGRVAAMDAAAGVDLLNTSQALVPTYAQMATGALSKEAVALSMFENAVAGARTSIMMRVAAAADTLSADQMYDEFIRLSTGFDAAAEDIYTGSDNIEKSFFELMDVQEDLLGGFDDQITAMRDTGKEGTKLADTIENKLKAAFDSLNSVVSGELQASLNELSNVGVNLDEFLPYKDKPAENARRLAAIMKEGLIDQPWLEEFKNEVPKIYEELVSSGDAQKAAGRMLEEFQKGLRPELIDFEQLKQGIRDKLETQMRMESMSKQLTAELIAEMGPEQGDVIRKFVAQSLGTGLDEGFGEESSAKLMAQFSSVEFKEQMKTAGEQGAENWALGFNTAAPEYLAPFMDLLAAYVTPIVESNIASKQSTSKAK